MLSEAEELWRGPAYSEVCDEPFARAEARRLEELRLLATETRMDAELTLGRHEAVTGELETLTSANPMRERLWSQRMLALYRCWPPGGGAAGVPGPAGHPGRRVGNRAGARRGLVGARRPRPGPGPRPPRSRPKPAPGLPPRVRRHRCVTRATRSGCRRPSARDPSVGRASESALLRDWWTSVGQGAGRLLLVDGDPGIGKTRLVSHLARARRGGRRPGAVGPLRRGSRRSVPAFRRGARALFPVPLGGPHFADARLAAQRALPPGAAPARVRADRRGRGRRSRERALPLLRGGDGDAQRARRPTGASSW